MHALLHSGRRGARGFGLRAASLRGVPLAKLAARVAGDERLPAPPPALSLGAAIESVHQARRAERAGAQSAPPPASGAS